MPDEPRDAASRPCPGAIQAAILSRAWCEARRWQREVNAALWPWRLSHTRYLLLDVADRLQQRGEFSQTQLARVVGIAESAVFRSVMALIDAGLLDREIDDCERAWLIQVTDQGRALLALTRPVVEALAVRFVSKGVTLPFVIPASSLPPSADG